jgi:hypothetical protein
MWDLFWGGLLVVAVSTAAFAAGLAVARHAPRAVSNTFGVLVLLSICWFVTGIYGTLAVARLLPFTNVALVGNWIPVGASFLSGLFMGHRRVTTPFHIITTLALLSLAWYALFSPLCDTRLTEEDRWSVDGVCLQTNSASCSACAAVMLLRTVGIHSTEREMTGLCLTNSQGTPTLGLYRGLKLKTDGTCWAVEVVQSNVEQMRRDASGPMLLLVRLSQKPGLRLASCWAGARSPGHAVLLYRFEQNDRAIVGDPAVGRRIWGTERLRDSWSGEGLRLVKRRAVD